MIGVPIQPAVPDDVEYVPLTVAGMVFSAGQFYILGFDEPKPASPLPGVRRMDATTDATGRGRVGGQSVDMFVQSAPAGDATQHTNKHWHQAGVRVRGMDDDAKVRSITTSGPSPDNDEELATYEVHLDEDVTRNYRQVVPALGDTATCSVTVVCRGDVAIEGISLWYDTTVDRWG